MYMLSETLSSPSLVLFNIWQNNFSCPAIFSSATLPKEYSHGIYPLSMDNASLKRQQAFSQPTGNQFS